MTTNISHSILRLGLLLGAFGWSVSFIFTFTPWSVCSDILVSCGLPSIEYQPLLNYWLKMASAAFGCIGILFFLCLMNKDKYLNVIPLLAYFSFFIGTVLLISSISNGLSPKTSYVFLADMAFCYLTGALIFSGSKAIKV